MEYNLKKATFTGQKNLILTHGDTIWEEICDERPLEDTFSVTDMIGEIPSIKHLSIVTQRQYLRAVLSNVYTGQEQDEPVLKRIGSRFWRFSLV